MTAIKYDVRVSEGIKGFSRKLFSKASLTTYNGELRSPYKFRRNQSTRMRLSRR
jgi:hypothetical protein